MDWGVRLSPRQLDLIGVYLRELIEWNSRMNLTGIVEPERMMIELFLDSLMAVPHIPSAGRMLDAGSGAGFPAVVIKLAAPGLTLRMVESNSKKVSFLKQVIRLLKLEEVEVINGRIESITDLLGPGGFDVVTSRALAGLDQIIKWCAYFLCDGGRLVYFAGSRAEGDLENSRGLMQDCNLAVDRLVPYHLPGMKGGRNLVILRKGTST